MADTFEFKPVLGSQDAIDGTAKEKGNFYMCRSGGIYFDQDDNTRIKLASIDANYVYEQRTASREWHINHNLGKFPNVSVIDSAGTEVKGEVIYEDKNNVILMFSGAFSGRATLN